ncbi:MAG: hypothetical protein JSV62_07855 [Promethearchaeota archaeon]|nr:MAG: hypothetical protein JSV62_07855 [Candidatus Lokiarchaeota archaeon]
MKTSREEMDIILKEVLDETNHSNSKFSISPYVGQGKKYLYLYNIQKNNGGM